MSGDATPAYVSGLADPRVIFLRNANHGVLAVNRNLGIRRAQGKYLAFCDDDDVWLPAKLEQQVSLLETDPQAALCFTNVMAVRGADDPGRRMFSRSFAGADFDALVWRNFICNSSVLVRRSAVEQVGLLDEDPRLTPYEDYHLWLRVAHRSAIRGIDAPLVRYRVHDTSFGAQFAGRHLVVVRVLLSAQRYTATHRLRFWCSAALRFVQHALSALRRGRR
jgi:glycosyltransferase involved in cell wall biosynthesis